MKKTPFHTRLLRFMQIIIWLIRILWTCRSSYLQKDEQQRMQQAQQWSAECLRILHIDLDIHGRQPEKLQHTLIVSNHVSWLDIFVLSKIFPVYFVAKKEIQGWPLIGRAIASLGTLFINREQRSESMLIAAAMAEKLECEQNMIFFPEARTSEDGLYVLPFKAALFESAIMSQSPILPVALRYYNTDEQRTTLPAYTRDISLWSSFWRIVSMPNIKVRVDIFPFVHYWEQENPKIDRFVLKEQVQKMIQEEVESDILTQRQPEST